VGKETKSSWRNFVVINHYLTKQLSLFVGETGENCSVKVNGCWSQKIHAWLKHLFHVTKKSSAIDRSVLMLQELTRKFGGWRWKHHNALPLVISLRVSISEKRQKNCYITTSLKQHAFQMHANFCENFGNVFESKILWNKQRKQFTNYKRRFHSTYIYQNEVKNAKIALIALVTQ
jgi:hypothetical protein